MVSRVRSRQTVPFLQKALRYLKATKSRPVYAKTKLGKIGQHIKAKASYVSYFGAKAVVMRGLSLVSDNSMVVAGRAQTRMMMVKRLLDPEQARKMINEGENAFEIAHLLKNRHVKDYRKFMDEASYKRLVDNLQDVLGHQRATMSLNGSKISFRKELDPKTAYYIESSGADQEKIGEYIDDKTFPGYVFYSKEGSTRTYAMHLEDFKKQVSVDRRKALFNERLNNHIGLLTEKAPVLKKKKGRFRPEIRGRDFTGRADRIEKGLKKEYLEELSSTIPERNVQKFETDAFKEYFGNLEVGPTKTLAITETDKFKKKYKKLSKDKQHIFDQAAEKLGLTKGVLSDGVPLWKRADTYSADADRILTRAESDILYKDSSDLKERKRRALIR